MCRINNKWRLPAPMELGLRGTLLHGHKRIMFPPVLLQFFSGTIVSLAHSCNFPTASGHRQLSLLSKTSILNVFFSIEHMHFFFFLNRIRFYESLKDRSYFLSKFAVMVQQELSCKACWDGHQPRMHMRTEEG